MDDAIGLLYTCPPCIGNVRLHKKRENRNTVIHCIGDMHLSGKVHSDGQSGVRFPGGARFLNNVFHFLIAVCEYSYQFHPIGLWCGSIPHGVTILFFHRVWFFAYFVHSKLSITARRLVTIFLHFGGKGPNRLV